MSLHSFIHSFIHTVHHHNNHHQLIYPICIYEYNFSIQFLLSSWFARARHTISISTHTLQMFFFIWKIFFQFHFPYRMDWMKWTRTICLFGFFVVNFHFLLLILSNFFSVCLFYTHIAWLFFSFIFYWPSKIIIM